jgi:hypothetical protein
VSLRPTRKAHRDFPLERVVPFRVVVGLSTGIERNAGRQVSPWRCAVPSSQGLPDAGRLVESCRRGRLLSESGFVTLSHSSRHRSREPRYKAPCISYIALWRLLFSGHHYQPRPTLRRACQSTSTCTARNLCHNHRRLAQEVVPFSIGYHGLPLANGADSRSSQDRFQGNRSARTCLL